MRRTAATAATMIGWCLVGLIVTRGQDLRRMDTATATQHAGEVATVCGQVIGYSCTTTDSSILLAIPGSTFSRFAFRIPPELRDKFGQHPEEQHLQKSVCATGRIGEQRSRFEIVLSDPSDVTVLPDRTGVPLFAPDVDRPCDAGIVAPKPLQEIKPRYSARAMRERAQGTVVVQALVNIDGTVDDARVVRGLHLELDAEAIDSVLRWRFEPGTRNGQPVPLVVVIELTYTLRQ